jgi:MFS family permease
MTTRVNASRRGLAVIFLSSFLALSGAFMLLPLNILRLTQSPDAPLLAGLFGATSWLGIFALTPWASWLTHRWGRRASLLVAGWVPVGSVLTFVFADTVAWWFVAQLAAGMAVGMRWVLSEALVAELAGPASRGRMVGLFETVIGLTFFLGPWLVAQLGADAQPTWYVALALVTLGALTNQWLPALPWPQAMQPVATGLKGVWQALTAHPIVMLVGLMAGFFEVGLSALLPVLGLALGFDKAQAALLIAASGLGSALLMWPTGWLADRLGRHHPQPHRVRWALMRGCATLVLLSTLTMPWVDAQAWLAWPLALIWGGAGGVLYTVVMIEIGFRHQGVALVNSTVVLVMAYTLGGMLAPSLGAAAMQWATPWGLTALLVLVAALGCAALYSRPAPP